MDEPESLNGKSDNSCFVRFQCFLFLLRRLIFDFIYLMSSDESGLIDDEYDDDGSDSGSSGTYYFWDLYLRFDYSVGSVSGLAYGIFVPTGVYPKCDIFAFVMFVSTGVD